MRMVLINDKKITISTAGSRKAVMWQPATMFWSEMVGRLRTAIRGTETLTEYMNLPKSQQDELKDVGGFVAGELKGGRRRAEDVISRDIITLDLDNIAFGGTDGVLRRVEGLGCAYAVYSTRKHMELKPRLRVLVPMSRTVTADEYEPLARKLADIIGINLADPTTFEASRLMYWPSCCSDSQYVFHYGDKPFLDADALLASYVDWRNIDEWPRVQGELQKHIKLAAKQGNPLEKTGVVGAFCREYDIETAMEKFLPGIYEPAGNGRYTYLGGSTVGGAILYEDGLFLYSHHATDPCSGKLVNAFDLVRLHKFSESDYDAKPGTPVNRLPSYAEMSAFALNNAGVAAVLNTERYEKAVAQFSTEIGQTVEIQQESNDFSWIQKLKFNPSTGSYLRTAENMLILLENDPNIKGRIRRDLFKNNIVGIAPLVWQPRLSESGEFEWTDDDDSGLALYMEKVLGFQTKEKLMHALSQCAMENRFHPVRSYLNSLVWDGVKRLDTLFIDYLGAADSSYTRDAARKSFVAAISRVMSPGCKYDTMPVLTGAQGIGKTSLIQKLGKSWFNNSLETFEGKDAAELLQGSWLIEIGEMSAYNRSDLETIKGFLSRTHDQFRAAYARRTEKHARQCVFFGTSNRYDYLKDATGGRRFWPIDCGILTKKKSVFYDKDFPNHVLLDTEVDQIWAEAVMYWRLGESLVLEGESAKEAVRQQESHTEHDAKEGLILEFIEKEVPLDWQKKSIPERRMYWSGMATQEVETMPRDRICAAEIWVEALGGEIKHIKRSDTMAINDILSRVSGWEKRSEASRFGPYGRVKGGYFRDN